MRRRAQRARPDKRRRPWAEAVPRSKDAAGVAEAEAGLAQEQDGAVQIRLRIKRRILQTTPQQPRSVLVDSAVDERW